MEQIVIDVVDEPTGVVFKFSTELGSVPELLGILVDDVQAESTVWGIAPSNPHFSHPLDIALSGGHFLPTDPVFNNATAYIGDRFSRPLPLVTFGVPPDGFAASMPEGATGAPTLVVGRRYRVTAFGSSGLGFLEFIAGGVGGAV